jgi:asparagine synthase (glutamine-hydrolysing)
LRARWRELKAKPEAEHPLHPRAYFALNAPFWPQMREYDDCAWTGSLVETRAPLLDVRLLRFELRLPPVPWCIDKEIVRRAMVGKLPEVIRRRPKAPLAQEPLDMFVTKSQWKPSPRFVSRRIHEFVNWKKWKATPLQKTGSNLLTAVRPIALDLWLKSIEMRDRIK